MNEETEKQRLERIAVAILAGLGASGRAPGSAAAWAIEQAKELIRQLDAPEVVEPAPEEPPLTVDTPAQVE